MADKKRRFWDVREYFKSDDANAVDKYGLTKIFEAAQKNKIGLVKELIADGADINFQFKRVADPGMSLNPFSSEPEFAEGSTPLHVAVLYGSISSMKVLMERGADLNRQDLDGCTPLDRALEKYNKLDEEILMVSDVDKGTKETQKKMKEHSLYRVISKLLARNGGESKVFRMSEKLQAEIVSDKDIADFTEPARKKRRFPRIRFE